MTQRVAFLEGENITRDTDYSKVLESIITPGVSEGLEVENGNVTPGFGFIEVTRSGETFYVMFHSNEDVVISTTGTKKVYIEIEQDSIDNGSTNNSDATGIGSIKTAAAYPSDNFIPLASISGGVITDAREMITGNFTNKNLDETITGAWEFIEDLTLAEKLKMSGTANIIEMTADGKVWNIVNGSDVLTIRENNTSGTSTRFRINAGGNIGIGAINPNKKLDVDGTSGYYQTGNEGTSDLDFASRGYVDGVAKSKSKSQTFTTNVNTGTSTSTYTHTLGYIPKRIEFIGNNGNSYDSHGVYTADDNSNNSVGNDYSGKFFQSGKCIYMKYGSDSSYVLSGEVTAITSTSFTITWSSGALISGFAALNILAILS